MTTTWDNCSPGLTNGARYNEGSKLHGGVYWLGAHIRPPALLTEAAAGRALGPTGPAHDGRLPLAPLERLVATWYIMAGQLRAGNAAQTIADAAGVCRRTVDRWRHKGLDEATADRIAVALGYHPCEVWGDAWWDR